MGKTLNYLEWALPPLGVGVGIGMAWGECAVLAYILIGTGVIGLLVKGLSLHNFEKLKDMSHDFKSSKVVWGLWNTGSEVMGKGLIRFGNIERVLIPTPSVKNKAVIIHAEMPGQRTPSEEVAEIERLKRILREKVRYLSHPFTYTLTFFDKTPVDNKPCSKKAWLLVQVHEPVMADLRHRYVIKNKGHTGEHFKAFSKLYEKLWDEAKTNAK